MASSYTTEPPPTASVLLQTTAGPLTISIFANQTPLTSRNFLQHVLDGYYDNNIFHRVSPGFVIQTGDPTGTGEGGQSIYEDREFERYDEDWARVTGREKDEPIRFGDELHSRLKFNRRGLVGMAKGTGDGSGGYGSQFFITLGDCRAELDGKCTMFGRVEGDGIYNVVKIAEGELVEGTERPLYPEKILKAEVIELPKGDAWQKMRKRETIAQRVVEAPPVKKKPAAKKKGGKALLSFGGDEGDPDTGEVTVVRPKKPKFNPALIDGGDMSATEISQNGAASKPPRQSSPVKRKEKSPSSPPTVPQKRKAAPSPPPPDSTTRITSRQSASASPEHRRKPSFHDPTTQLPLRNPESPSRSPTPDEETNKGDSKKFALEAEIAELKASMRRNVTRTVGDTSRKKSALEALIPATSTRGRKRPRPGETNSKDDATALKMLNAFKARLEQADSSSKAAKPDSSAKSGDRNGQPQEPSGDPDVMVTSKPPPEAVADDEEAALCDLHFIANCQSCSRWDEKGGDPDADSDDDGGKEWMSHALSFAKDRLGKDLNWKKKNEEELVVIDPREKEKELKSRRKDRDRGKDKGKGKGGKGFDRDRRW
ncbi:cyclophilin-like protein, partial [Aureobasidium melanogenum]